MKFPALNDWQHSSHGLHQAAQILGAIRMLVRDPVPNYLELGLRIETMGLSSERLPSGGELHLDLGRAALICVSNDGRAVEVALVGHTQRS